MPASGTFRFDPIDAGWRMADGHALVVSRATGHLHRLDRIGTRIWETLAGAAPAALELGAIERALAGAAPALGQRPILRAGLELFLADLVCAGLLRGDGPAASGDAVGSRDAGASHRPQQRRIDGAWQIVERIGPAPAASARRVGGGILLGFPDGSVSLLGAEAALLWARLAMRSRTYVDLLDALSESCGLSYEEAERIAAPLVASWIERGAVLGLERVERFPASWTSSGASATIARDLGRLDGMRAGAPPGETRAAPRPGTPATLRDPPQAVDHVAIVCQYGIHGLAPGVEPYSQRCIARLRALRPDLVILSGGGRHGSSALREAESVIERYLEQLPGPGLWLEKHSATTWENLQNSLEMLEARSVVPRRVSLLGDRARAEKLRLACFLARRRFGAFRRVGFQVVPVKRPRFTWRDTRSIQVVVGTVQILEESRRKRLARGAR